MSGKEISRDGGKLLKSRVGQRGYARRTRPGMHARGGADVYGGTDKRMDRAAGRRGAAATAAATDQQGATVPTTTNASKRLGADENSGTGQAGKTTGDKSEVERETAGGSASEGVSAAIMPSQGGKNDPERPAATHQETKSVVKFITIIGGTRWTARQGGGGRRQRQRQRISKARQYQQQPTHPSDWGRTKTPGLDKQGKQREISQKWKERRRVGPHRKGCRRLLCQARAVKTIRSAQLPPTRRQKV